MFSLSRFHFILLYLSVPFSVYRQPPAKNQVDNKATLADRSSSKSRTNICLMQKWNLLLPFVSDEVSVIFTKKQKSVNYLNVPCSTQD